MIVSGAEDSYAKHLAEEEWDNKAEPGGEEDLGARAVGRMIHSVICSVRGPPSGETVYNSAEGKHTAHFCSASAPFEILEVAAVGEDTQSDEEDDSGGQPGPELVGVHNFVAEEGDQECAERNYQDASVAWNIAVHGVDELGTDNGIDGRPADAGQHVEDGDQLHSPPAEPETREYHLAQPEARTESCEVADWRNADQVEE